MTKRLYHDDPYMDRFEATVLRVEQGDNGLEIILDQTAFFPEAGGQPSDMGQLNGSDIVIVREDEREEIVHTVASGQFKVGEEVEGIIDINRRLENMRRHTGQHILSRAFIKTADVDTISANHGEVGTIELSIEELTDQQLDRAERLANEIVMKNLSITPKFYDESEIKNLPLRKIPDREGAFRIVHIGDYDVNACGGTHCRRTGEVGPIKIIGTEKLRGHFRISFLCGSAALDDYREKHRVLTSVATSLTCHFTDLPEKVSRLTGDNQELRRVIAHQNKQLFEYELAGMIEQAPAYGVIKLLTRRFSSDDFNQVKDMALMAANKVKAVAVFSDNSRLIIACSEGTNIKANDLAREFMDRFGGKGGGGPVLAQVGNIDENRMDKFLDDFEKVIEERLAK